MWGNDFPHPEGTWPHTKEFLRNAFWDLPVDDTAAMAAQLMIEYDPQPPFDAGALAKCDATVVERVIEYAALRQ